MQSAITEMSGSERFGMSPVPPETRRAASMDSEAGSTIRNRPVDNSASSAPYRCLMCDTSPYTAGVVTYDSPSFEPNGTPA